MITKEERNANILAHILRYCQRIGEYLSRFDGDAARFMSDAMYCDAVAMCEFQIGELTGRLSDEFKERHSSEIPWKAIRGMRNLFAHDYLNMDKERIWNSATVDVPALKKFCEEQIKLSETDKNIRDE